MHQPGEARPRHRSGARANLTYGEALDFLRAAGDEHRGMVPGLERIRGLLDALGHPELGLRGVLVAGSNGKGSVCALVDSACRAAGLRTVLLVKPHLVSYRERIVVDGAPVSQEEFAELVSTVAPAAGAAYGTGFGVRPPTQFEILTAVGILAAARHRPDVVICEVGLGGRLDSTNVLDLGVAAVTTIAAEHRQYLGDTVEEIAREKAAIIKEGNHAVTGAEGGALVEVRRRASAVRARLSIVGEEIRVDSAATDRSGVSLEVTVARERTRLRVPLPGDFQVANAAVASGVCAALSDRGLPVDAEAMARGFAKVRWPARMEWIPGHPSFLVDGAHNPAAVEAMVPAATAMTRGRPAVLLFAVMRDKEVEPMLAALRPLNAQPVFTQVDTPRSMRATDLAHLWGPGSRAIATLNDALDAARLLARGEGVVVVCGSIYLAGAVLDRLGRAAVTDG